MALGLFWALNIVLAAVSAVLVAILAYVYARNAREVRSRFTIGLVLFALLLLVQNLAGMWIYMSMNDAGMKGDVAIPMLVLNVAETGALGSLVAVSWE